MREKCKRLPKFELSHVGTEFVMVSEKGSTDTSRSYAFDFLVLCSYTFRE